jgi:hypothetical protein
MARVPQGVEASDFDLFCKSMLWMHGEFRWARHLRAWPGWYLSLGGSSTAFQVSPARPLTRKPRTGGPTCVLGTPAVRFNGPCAFPPQDPHLPSHVIFLLLLFSTVNPSKAPAAACSFDSPYPPNSIYHESGPRSIYFAARFHCRLPTTSSAPSRDSRTYIRTLTSTRPQHPT